MTKAGIHINDLPSKKFNNQLEKGINYDEIEKYIESDTFSSEGEFWINTLNGYVRSYIDTFIGGWSENNYDKRCRDFNYILDLALKKVTEKCKTKMGISYDLIEQYVYNSAKYSLEIYGDECTRNSKIKVNYDDIENMKKFDDLCEDIDYIKSLISDIDSDNCKQIESYIDQKITDIEQIYTKSSSKYSHILEHYHFQSFDEINTTLRNLKSKCQEGIDGVSLTGDHSETSHHSGGSAPIIAVTSLSGILSSFFLLYKTTSFGSILNTLIRNKIKFGNNLSDEAYYETLKDIPESSHDGAYNILYNSVGDS
ncbi:PIR Superfamily Protein [Plasmodium ovale wallikeri]|uniref:PIR Superfamily Protein n=1 Tax=Plasmodium ovale wallikeri TaxID=864142 RepID=A0A1A9AMW4_PLAOA|nr:PIR Superfamily Protein [Plasmodium ovale wallikeri]SBT59481.1 PIR Superfamily Protein [Plasmodium ovale wallikeri]